MTNQPPTKHPIKQATKQSVAQTYERWRFLIADDHAFMRAMVHDMLSRLKVREVLHAANGEQAGRLLRKYGATIDCVISDCNMAPVNGLELLRDVRTGAIPGTPPGTCFIVLTGHAAEKVVKTAIALDANAYLVKPVTFEKLCRAIDTAMAKPLTLKSRAEYLGVGDFDIPDSTRAAGDRGVPWGVWMKLSRRHELEEHIRRDLADVGEAGAGGPVADGVVEIKNTRSAVIDEITAGMVLAEDIYAGNETLLIAAGTVITPELLAHFQKMAESAAEKPHLWIADTEIFKTDISKDGQSRA